MTADLAPSSSYLGPSIEGLGTALPPHRYDQAELLTALRRIWQRHHFNEERLTRLHEAVQVGGRALALPIQSYEALDGFGAANEAFVSVASDLSEASLRRAMDRAGVAPRDIDALFFTTVTGIATPSIDAHLVNRLSLRRDVKRVPMFGLGCVGGAAGLARVADYLRGHPEDVAVLVSAELCSLTLQRGDLSIPNFIATGLFGDGCASVVISGARRADASRRRVRGGAAAGGLYPPTQGVMGRGVRDTGLKVILSSALADFIRDHVAADVRAFVRSQGYDMADIDHWICHPGGPKVLSALEESLELEPRALRRSRELLEEVGNLSSASVLFVLDRTLPDAGPGDLGVLMAMGPGFCAELVLLSWS